MHTKNYYNEIKETLVNNEAYKRVKDYSKNRNELMSYYKVGKLLIEAQGGEERAKYGDNLIKEYSKKLTTELGKGYDASNLKRFRAFYLLIQKGGAMRHQLSWTHYRYMLSLKNIEEINYYIDVAITERLSYRKLRQRIKENEYERLPHKEEIESPKINTYVKNPIIIYTNKESSKLSEKILKNLILDDLDYFLSQLGVGFTYVGNEVPMKIGNRTHHADILLYNYIYHRFVVIELKLNEFCDKDVGQITKYINYVDKHMKGNNDDTFGIIVCKKGNELLLSYVKSSNIEIINYKIFMREIS